MRTTHIGTIATPRPRRARRHGRAVATTAVAALLGTIAIGAVTATSAAAKPTHTNYHGVVRETPTGVDLGYNLSGAATMTVHDDHTTVKVNVAGLDPTKTYGSHLHNGTCTTGGGGHYQNDEGGATTPPNELWLSSTPDAAGGLTANPGGTAHGAGTATWVARTDSTTQTNARSIIVHEPGGVRIACADLH